ncbi:hypothetical protein DFS34DRAFT_300974 [Phlyctochytrium arcticum]|nr:hypothetical protein DFS34DRAFT_300974 [Phlyctochytrium arcticum]
MSHIYPIPLPSLAPGSSPPPRTDDYHQPIHRQLEHQQPNFPSYNQKQDEHFTTMSHPDYYYPHQNPYYTYSFIPQQEQQPTPTQQMHSSPNYYIPPQDYSDLEYKYSEQQPIIYVAPTETPSPKRLAKSASNDSLNSVSSISSTASSLSSNWSVASSAPPTPSFLDSSDAATTPSPCHYYNYSVPPQIDTYIDQSSLFPPLSPKRHSISSTTSSLHTSASLNSTTTTATSSPPPSSPPQPPKPRPYACTTCPKTFARNQDLKRHLVTHIPGYKPFRCDLCGTGFTRSDAVRRHLKARRCM